ncbi:Eaa1 [Raoultella ornithinolytica]|nr:Eaa1 [Raoultella ornithinolytica]
MTSKITREQLHERARENVKALKMASRQTAFESAREEILADLQLAELALAAMDSEPVAWMHSNNNIGIPAITVSQKIGRYWMAEFENVQPLYRHAQTAPVDNTFIPKNLDKALGVVGVALPESKEEFNFQIERWIQRLIDRVIRYADEFKEQPAPVVTFYRDGIEAAANYLDKQRESFDNEHGQFDPDTNSFEFGSLAAQEHSDTLAELAEGIRALHPNAGNSPVIPDGYRLQPISEYEAMCATVNSDEWPQRWIPVSERMPEDRTQVILWDAEIGEVTSGHYSHKTHTFYHCGDAIQNEITHWMPPPAAPQEVKP